MRGPLVPAVIGCVLCCGFTLSRPMAAHAESVLKCVSSETLSGIGDKVETPQPDPHRLGPDPVYDKNNWFDADKRTSTIFSLKASANGRAEFRLFDIPERDVTRSIARVLDCMADR